MTREAVVEKLFQLYKNRGFVTTEDIFTECDEVELSIFDTDYVSNKILELGVLVTDEAPLSKTALEHSAYSGLTDYAQTDYSEIYAYFNYNYPGMRMVIDYIQGITPIQHGEMNQLIKQIRSGNHFAKSIAFDKNMRLALKATYNYKNKTTLSLEDIFQQACISILKAIDAYDPYVHSAFTSYCSTWIFQGIERYRMDTEGIIRVPVHLYEKLIEVEKEINTGIYSTRNELISNIADRMQVSNLEADELLSYYEITSVAYLDEIYDDYDDILLYSSVDLQEISELSELKNTINEILSELPPREANVLKMRFGIDCPREYTLAEIAEQLNVTRERIRQIEAKAIRRLGHTINRIIEGYI